MRYAIILVAMLALGGCGAAEERAPIEEPTPDPIVADLKETIDLQASGITVPPQGGSEAIEVPLGSMRAAAEASLAAILGEIVSRSANGECPAGPLEMTEYEGLTLNFQEDRFVGWSAREPYLPEQTRAELLAADGIALFADSTLGEEFTIGDPEGRVISGLFAEAGEDAPVIALWAGANCIFR